MEKEEICYDNECLCCFYDYSITNNIPLSPSSSPSSSLLSPSLSSSPSSLCSHSLCYKCIYQIYLKNSFLFICPLCFNKNINYNFKINYNLLNKINLNSFKNQNNFQFLTIFSYKKINQIIKEGRLKEKLFCFSSYYGKLFDIDVIILTLNSNCLNDEFNTLIQQFEDEIPRLSQIQHQNISQYIGFSNEDNGDNQEIGEIGENEENEDNLNIIHKKLQKAYVIKKYQDTLSSKLFRNQTIPLTSKQRLKIAIGISSALQYLHNLHNHLPFKSHLPSSISLSFFSSHQFLHGNLTCDNIELEINEIITKTDTNETDQTDQTNSINTTNTINEEEEVEYIPKLTNLSIFTMLQNYFKSQSLNVFSNSYLAPEGKFGIYDSKSEIYLFGIILIELLTGRPAISILESVERSFTLNSTVLFTKFRERYLDTSCEWNDDLWQGILTLAKQCLHRSRNERPNIDIIYDTLNNLLNTKVTIVPETTLKKASLEKKMVGKLKTSSTKKESSNSLKISSRNLLQSSTSTSLSTNITPRSSLTTTTTTTNITPRIRRNHPPSNNNSNR